jgi:hypothetical protein
VAETLYDIYCREAEMSGDEPLSRDDLAVAWMQYEFDPASERLADVVRERWNINLHRSVGRAGGLAWLTGDHLEYLCAKRAGADPDEDVTATLYVGWVEDLRTAEDIFVLVPDGGDDVPALTAITEAKLKEAPYAEGSGAHFTSVVRDDEGNPMLLTHETPYGETHLHFPEPEPPPEKE